MQISYWYNFISKSWNVCDCVFVAVIIEQKVFFRIFLLREKIKTLSNTAEIFVLTSVLLAKQIVHSFIYNGYII